MAVLMVAFLLRSDSLKTISWKLSWHVSIYTEPLSRCWTCILGCNDVQSSSSPTFRRNVRPRLKCRKVSWWSRQQPPSDKRCLPHSFAGYFAWLTLPLWRWRQNASPKCRWTTGFHIVTSRKTVLFIVNSVQTSGPPLSLLQRPIPFNAVRETIAGYFKNHVKIRNILWR
jgi:hypothetical protein